MSRAPLIERHDGLPDFGLVDVELPLVLVTELAVSAPLSEPVLCRDCLRIYERPLTGTPLQRSIGCPFCGAQGWLGFTSHLPRIRLTGNALREALVGYGRPTERKVEPRRLSAHEHYAIR